MGEGAVKEEERRKRREKEKTCEKERGEKTGVREARETWRDGGGREREAGREEKVDKV